MLLEEKQIPYNVKRVAWSKKGHLWTANNGPRSMRGETAKNHNNIEQAAVASFTMTSAMR